MCFAELGEQELIQKGKQRFSVRNRAVPSREVCSATTPSANVSAMDFSTQDLMQRNRVLHPGFVAFNKSFNVVDIGFLGGEVFHLFAELRSGVALQKQLTLIVLVHDFNAKAGLPLAHDQIHHAVKGAINHH
jgi:hypothetical protein